MFEKKCVFTAFQNICSDAREETDSFLYLCSDSEQKCSFMDSVKFFMSPHLRNSGSAQLHKLKAVLLKE